MQATTSLIRRPGKSLLVCLGSLLVVLGSLLRNGEATPAKPTLQLELADLAEDAEDAEDEGAPKGEAQTKTAKSIPEPSFAAALAAGTGILLTVNYWRRRFGR